MKRKIYLIVFLFSLAVTNSFGQWTSTNGPFGGTIIDLERDGSGAVYALVSNNSIYKSTDNGVTWVRLTTVPSSLFLTDILFANNKFYGIYFSNFYTSTDGLSWTRVNSVPFTSAQKLFKFGADGYIAAYGTDGVYVSKDDGTTWVKALSDNVYAYSYDKAIATTNGDLYVVSRNTTQGYGFEVKRLPYPGANGAFSPSNWQVKYSTLKTGTITASTSSSTVSGSGTQFLTQMSLGASLYANSGNGIQYLGVISSISSNTSLTLSGPAFSNQSNATYSEADFGSHLMTNGSNIYLVRDRDILSSENSGTTWASIKGNITDPSFWGNGDLNTFNNTIYYYNGAYNKVYSLANPSSTNNTWTITDVNGSLGAFGANISTWGFLSSTVVLGGSNSAGVFRSTNSGSTYALSSNGIVGGIGRGIVMTNSGNKLILANQNTRGYWLSSDGGANWSFVATTNFYSKALKLSDGTLILFGNNSIARSSDNLTTPFVETYQVNVDIIEIGTTLYAVSGSQVYSSTNRGADPWTLLNVTGWPASQSARFISTDNTDLYINTSGTTQKILRIPLAGGAVTDLTTYPGTTSLISLFHIGSTLYAAQSATILRSSDQGATWITIGFSGNSVFPLTEGTTTSLCVGRAGSFYLSQDAGNSWNSYSLPSSTGYITGITRDPNSSASNPVYYASAGLSPALKFSGKLLVDPASLPPYINFNWQPLNGPYGGSQTDVAVHPDGSLYSIQGGAIFKYNGITWARVNPISATLTNILDMFIDSTGKIYALTSSGGINTPRIYTSTDGGLTWSARSATSFFFSNPSYFSGIRMEKLNDNSIIVLTSSARIFRSTDDGVTFSQVASFSNEFFSSTAPILKTSTLVAAFGSNQTGLVFSSDNGATWASSTVTGLPVANGFNAFIGSYAVAPNGDFLVVLAESYDATKLLYGPYEVYRSTDLGQTWSKVTTPTSPYFQKRIMVMPNGDYILGIATDNSQYKSTDRGSTWTPITSVGEAFSYYEASGSDVYMRGSFAGIFKSSDNGTTSTPINNGIPRVNNLDIELIDNKDLITVSGSQHMYSGNLGQSWSVGSVQNVSRFLVKGDSVIGFGGRKLSLTTDNGKTWSELGSDRFFTFVTTFDGKSFYAASNSSIVSRGLFFSTDLVNWTQVNVSGLPASFSYLSLAVDQNGVIFAVVQEVISNTAILSLYQIAFEVATKISGIINPVSPRNVFLYKGKIYLYDANGTIFTTQNSGNSWETISAPAGNILNISNDYLFISANNTVLWLSRTNGTSWQSVGENFISGSNFQKVIVNEFDGFAYGIQTNNVVKKSQVIVLVDDLTAPVVSSLSPANNSVGVSLKPTLKITFNEAAKPVTGKKIRIFDLANPSASLEIIDASAAVQDGKSFSIIPTINLAFGKTYFVTLESGSFQDIFGNNFSGIVSNSVWRFTTKALPTITILAPASGATNTSAKPSLVITFSEPVQGLASKNVVVYKESAPTVPIVTISATSGVRNGNSLTFTLPSSLEFSTTYFAKFDATSFTTIDGGTFNALSQNTDWTFTTRAAPLVASTLPANNATNVAINTALLVTFNEAVSPVGTKKLFVSTTATPPVIVATINLSSATVSGSTVTFALPAPVNNSTVYNLTFEAGAFTAVSDGGTFSPLTTTGWQFTTIAPPDTQAPVITFTADAFAKGAANKTFSPTITDNIGVVQPRIFYRSITSNATESSANLTFNSSTSKYDVSIPDADFGKMGLEYYFTATDAAGNNARSPQTGYHYSYISFPSTVNPSIPGSLIGVGGNQTDWRIIGVPHALNDASIATVFSELGAVDKSKWRIVTYKSPTAWDELTSGSVLAQGKGYFINMRTSTALAIDGATTPSFNKSNLFKMVLNPGWNQIGNPYTFDLVWSEVLTANGNPNGIGGLKKYKGSYVDEPDLKFFEGAFVLNSTASAVTLNVPITGSLAGGRSEQPQYDLSGESWVMPIELQVGQYKNVLGGIGMHPNASTDVDQYDDFNPPSLGEDAKIEFAHPNHFLKNSTREFVHTQNEFVWRFTVNSEIQGEATLSWKNELFGNNNLEVYLVDTRLMKVVDMRAQNRYSFDTKTSDAFEIHFGKNMASRVTPSQISLGKAYPNPASGKVNIPFAIPELSEAHQINLEIFDITGKKINTVISNRTAGGYYQAVWESDNFPISSGLYIYRLTVSGRDRNEVLFDKVMIQK